MHNPAMIETGMSALSWLIRLQISLNNSFQARGSDCFCHHNGTRAYFDQQPV